MSGCAAEVQFAGELHFEISPSSSAAAAAAALPVPVGIVDVSCAPPPRALRLGDSHVVSVNKDALRVVEPEAAAAVQVQAAADGVGRLARFLWFVWEMPLRLLVDLCLCHS